MKIEKVNIGLSIEQKLKELGISKSEFGRKIGIPQQNVNRILGKTSIDTEKLVSISVALDYNFFTEFVENGDEKQSVALVGNNNQVIGHGSNDNFNGDINTPILEERIKSLEALLAEKERLIKVLMEGK